MGKELWNLVFSGLILIFMVTSISGCIDFEEKDSLSDVQEHDVEVNDIWIWFVVEWKEPIIDSFVIIPTLQYENGTYAHPNGEWTSKDRYGEPVPSSDDNFTIMDSEHGKALKYEFSRPSYWKEEGPYHSKLRLPVILDEADIIFNTKDEMDIKDRFFEGGPGFSIWEEKDGKVKTWIYVDHDANWIRLYLERGGDMDNDHTWGNFDCSKGITYEIDGRGWFNVELERRTSFPMM